MLRAFDGPVPILIMVMPLWSGSTRWKAGICGPRSGGVPTGAASPSRVTTSPSAWPHPARRAHAGAGLDEGDAARTAGHRHALAADAGEGIHVELVVGEDDEVLEIVRVGTGVVVEQVQRIVDAGGAEQRERRRRARRPRQRAVDDGVVHGGEVGHVATNTLHNASSPARAIAPSLTLPAVE